MSRKKRSKKVKPGAEKSKKARKQTSTRTTVAGKKALPKLASRNDLLDIAGIEPHIEHALNSLGVLKFSDLANYTPQTLAQALREQAGLDISSETIVAQDWIGRAKKLESEKRRQAKSPGKKSTEDVMQKSETKSDKPKQEHEAEATHQPNKQAGGSRKSSPGQVEKARAPKEQPEQTAHPAQPEQTDETDVPEASQQKSPPQGDPGELMTMLSRQAAEKSQQSSPAVHENRPEAPRRQAAPATSRPKTGKPVRPATSRTHQLLVNVTSARLATSDRALSGEIKCHLIGERVTTLFRRRPPLTAQIHAVNTRSGESVLLYSRSLRLQPQQTQYSIPVEFSVGVEAGRYQLQFVAFVHDDQPGIGYRRGPVLNVEG